VPEPQAAPQQSVRRVLVISVDGLRPDALAAAEGVPHVAALQARGTSARSARTVVPPLTLPAHVSMLTGYLPAGHGVSWNDGWHPEQRLRVPSVFGLARRAGLRTVLVTGKLKFRQFDEAGCLDSFVLANGDVAVANAAVVAIQAGFDLMLVHLADVDAVGHRSGWMSAEYLDQVAAADRAVGRILAALPSGTTVILTADHGGNARGHGEDRPEDMSIPWVIAGPGVLMGYTLPPQAKVTTLDTAATAAYVLGFALPSDAGGRPVLAAFRIGASTGLRPAA
jgi:predicted AlkP superfamily pyrophosphatase or phosphodiesterase